MVGDSAGSMPKSSVQKDDPRRRVIAKQSPRGSTKSIYTWQKQFSAARKGHPRGRCVDFHAELTLDLHRELTHQRIMFGGQVWAKA
jgi:hypothetical protein